ncbi:MAG: caspase family protein, partial [Alphaproteobacteria bacterium]
PPVRTASKPPAPARLAAPAPKPVASLNSIDAGSLDFGKFHALVIGNDTYGDLPKLGPARADAERIAGVLNREYGYTVTLLRDATRDQILDAFDRLRRELDEDDNLLIYYAGHGWLDPDADRGYWLPVVAR